jgi:hypothetical protein
MPPTPPAKPGPASAPPSGGAPDPTQIIESVKAELPNGTYTVALIQKLADETNKAMKAVLGDAAPDGEVVCPEYPEKKHNGQLPVECILPALILLGEASAVDKKYATDPAEIRDDSDLREVIAKVGMLAKDKKVKAAMTPEPEEEVEVKEEVSEGPPEGVAEAM